MKTTKLNCKYVTTINNVSFISTIRKQSINDAIAYLAGVWK